MAQAARRVVHTPASRFNFRGTPPHRFSRFFSFSSPPVPKTQSPLTADEQSWFQQNPEPTHPRTKAVLEYVRENGCDIARKCVENQLKFAVIPTTLLGGCSLAALFSQDLPKLVQLHPYAAQFLIASLGTASIFSMFHLAHSNLVYSMVQYSPNGPPLLNLFRDQAHRLSIFIWTGAGTQVLAALGLLSYLWLSVEPAVSALTGSAVSVANIALVAGPSLATLAALWLGVYQVTAFRRFHRTISLYAAVAPPTIPSRRQ